MRIKKLVKTTMLLSLTIVMAGIIYHQNNVLAENLSGKVIMFHAGSLTIPLAEIEKLERPLEVRNAPERSQILKNPVILWPLPIIR